MNLPLLSLNSPRLHPLGCQATLRRLIGNLHGFAYRRRHDSRWTMDFISVGCRNVTGYDPHRFMANGSIAFADLVAPLDRPRVNERVRHAVRHRHRVLMDYALHTAHGALVRVEDRFTPIFDTTGKLLAIEGVVDLARSLAGGAAEPVREGLRHRDWGTVDQLPLSGAMLAPEQSGS